ncbi:hypothetical protein GH714_014492 [Hevea brasiliensis]|uniref:AMP-dependent synthetase/ligase domain-containing protein n=1 Tax=Hevea brasiliensis TaxID=3981 RepID=A0A6A6KQS9_HEVBR|nr:hypothetical protein GH714_014492 [Hevea brasiliensis]
MEHLKHRRANSSPLTPLGFLERAATVYGDCLSIIYNTTSYTWSHTHRRCLQLASCLSSLGIKPGQVVSVLAPNIPAMYELHFAVPMAGAILNSINTRLDARTVSILLRHSESKLLFVDYFSKSLVLEAVSLFPGSVKPPVLVLITDDEVSEPPNASLAVDFIDTYMGVGWKRGHSVTHMCGAPVVLNMLSNSLADNQTKLENPVHILTAGAPPPASILSRTESLGFIVSHGYGLTETGGIVVSCAWKPQWNLFPATERARLKARQGVRTIGMTEVDVVDPESGVSVKRDGSSLGEIVLREIKDRSKDVIISGGENLSSVEVESVLYTNPMINEAAVVARPDEFWGETPCAFVSLKKNNGDASNQEAATEKYIIEYCRARLPHYMVPKTVVVKEELPKTSTGKIKKYELREMAKAMGSSRISRL